MICSATAAQKHSARVIAVVNQKGGVGKTTTVLNLAASLTAMNRRVLAVDSDPQSSLTLSMGFEKVSRSLVELILSRIEGGNAQAVEAILPTPEGDLLPSTLQLSGIEAAVYGAMHREHLLEEILESARAAYDYILIDCPPTLGMMTVNALTAADSILIPVIPNYLSLMGLQDLLAVTIPQVKRRLNKHLEIEGILPTMTTNQRVPRDILATIREAYGRALHIYDSGVPLRAAVQQASALRVSCASYEKGDAAKAYRTLAQVIMAKEGVFDIKNPDSGGLSRTSAS